MAASEFDRRSERSRTGGGRRATGDPLSERLEEEVARAERLDSGLSCMALVVENLDGIKQQHGERLADQVMEYVSGALHDELRRFDRVCRGSGGELVMIVPGAGAADSELIARRALERLRAIKVEAGGSRLALQVSVGLATWRAEMDAEELLARARAALERLGAENGAGGEHGPTAQADRPPGGESEPAGGSPPTGEEHRDQPAGGGHHPLPPEVGRGSAH